MGVGNSFRHRLETGHFAVTAEITPPRGASLDDLGRAAADLDPVVSAVNLTDGAGANVRLSGLAAAIHVKQLGLEPILQMTCRDRNRLAIQADLLGAAAFGITNVLALSGDPIDAGSNPDAKAVYDLDTRSLLRAMTSLAEGRTLSGSVLDCRPAFFPGAADMPVEPAPNWTPDGLMSKSAAGAKFVQMQYCFDLELLGRYVGRLRDHGLTERLYFLAGLGPLRSAESAAWMRANLPGTVIPEGIVRRLAAARDPRHEGIAICAELMREAREMEGIAGVHLMAPGRHQAVVEAVRLSASL